MWITVALVVLGGLTALYLWIQKKFRYFADRGIPHDRPIFPFGSNQTLQLLTGKVSFLNMLDSICQRFKGVPVVGYYGFLGDRFLVIQDMDLIKDVLIKDFDHFVDRRDLDIGANNKHLQNMMLSLRGDRWRAVRGMVSPIFTSGKLKNLTPLIDKVGDRLVEHLEKYADEAKEFESKAMMTHFTMEVIGSVGFGIEVDSFGDPDSTFRDNIAKLTKTGKHRRTTRDYIKMSLFLLFPRLAKLLKMQFMNPDAANFLVNIIKRQMEDRRNDGGRGKRSDFIDILTQALRGAGAEQTNREIFNDEELETIIVSNGFLLFLAGFDTSSSGLATTLYHLATTPKVQERLHREIREAIEDNNLDQHLTYNHMQALPYLEMCINESLRKYPLANLERKCVKDYRIRGTDIVVPEGMLVQIPAINIMKDDRYFPDPDV